MRLSDGQNSVSYDLSLMGGFEADHSDCLAYFLYGEAIVIVLALPLPVPPEVSDVFYIPLLAGPAACHRRGEFTHVCTKRTPPVALAANFMASQTRFSKKELALRYHEIVARYAVDVIPPLIASG